MGYGAVILAFLGGCIGASPCRSRPRRGERARLGLGVVPSLVGWMALLIAFVGAVNVALGVLLLGFAGTTAVEARGTRAGLVPRSYMALRYVLSGAVLLVLLVVLLLRLAGGHLALW